jgi:hypothetical protein
VGDLVLWDNRRSLHRGLPFDEQFPRDMRRVTTSDGTEPVRGVQHAEMMAGGDKARQGPVIPNCRA